MCVCVCVCVCMYVCIFHFHHIFNFADYKRLTIYLLLTTFVQPIVFKRNKCRGQG